MTTVVQPLMNPHKHQEVVERLVQGGVDKQVANDLAGRIVRKSAKPNPHDDAATDAFIGTVLKLASGGQITSVR